jgi:hypothetical protein
MFDWLGTFNRSQFERLANFAKDQLPLLDARINHLTVELSRLGTMVMTKDGKGLPTGYAPQPANSYLGKLLAVYEILGGDPFYDLQVRSTSEPVYLMKGDEVSTPKFFSNGDPISDGALADAPSANLVMQLKSWVNDTIDRREYLERKIRRVIDYGDQLRAEMDLLKKIRGSAQQSGSLEFIISQVSTLINDKRYRAVADDKGRDKFGKYTRARFSAYEPGPSRDAPEGEGVERTDQGYYVYGDDTESSSDGSST